jgi:cobalt/nickel transport system ATP-binding protein
MPIVHEKEKIKVIDPCAQFEGQGNVLSVEGLHYSYPDGRKVLNGVSFEMEWCEKVALVGPNGAGKSTFLQNINGLLEGEGEINLPVIRAKVGFVFQNPDDQLFSPTVYEDVAFGPLHMGFSETEIAERVDRALDQVGMRGYAQRLSHYLSTGEKKRVAIATVLAMDPSMLILDEPTANLDPRARRSLIKLLNDLPIAMIIATHDLQMVEGLLPRMVLIDNGVIAADGGSKELLQDTDLLQRHGL